MNICKAFVFFIAFLSMVLFFSSDAAFASRSSTAFVDIFPINLQQRFEDSSQQERTNQQYDSYGFRLKYDQFLTEFELSQRQDKSGNSGLNVETRTQEYLLGLGYEVWQADYADSVLRISLIPKLWIGRTQTRIKTVLLETSGSNNSDPALVYGTGISGLGRIGYFVFEPEVKWLTSKNMNPADVAIFSIKMGFGIPLN